MLWDEQDVAAVCAAAVADVWAVAWAGARAAVALGEVWAADAQGVDWAHRGAHPQEPPPDNPWHANPHGAAAASAQVWQPA